MRLASVTAGNRSVTALGVGADVALLSEVAAATGSDFPDVDQASLIAAYPEHQAALRALAEQVPALVASGAVRTIDATRVGPPVPRPGKIIAIGLNYADHARETGQPIPTIPVIFAKFPTSVAGAGTDIVRPTGVDDLDYEAELGVVIGRRARHVSADAALDHVLGFVTANDVSARTEQLATGQWVKGKSFDTFCPSGPFVVTPDETGDIQSQPVRLWVDGEIRQDSNTSEMIFGVAELVSYLSRAFTLEPGDLVLTGTPPGVAMGIKPSPWLLPGQVCEVEIGNLGRLRNRVVQEALPA